MGEGIYVEVTNSIFGISAAAVELHYATGQNSPDCPAEPMIPVWVNGELASTNPNPQLTSYRRFSLSSDPSCAPDVINSQSVCHFGQKMDRETRGQWPNRPASTMAMRNRHVVLYDLN